MATFRKPTIRMRRSASSGEITPASWRRRNASCVSCGTPSRRRRTTCIAKSIAASQARCRFKMIESWRVGFSVRLRSSPAYSSRTRATQRSMMAALLTTTSSAMHAPLAAYLIENRAAFLVQSRIGRKGMILECFLRRWIERPQQGARGDDLHAHDRRSATQIDQIDVAPHACCKTLLHLEPRHGLYRRVGEERDIDVTVAVRLPRNGRAEAVDGDQPGKRLTQERDDLSIGHDQRPKI